MKTSAGSKKNKMEALGHAIFYAVIKILGLRGGYLLLALVVFAYVLFSRKIHRKTMPYINRRFPDHNLISRWFDTYLLAFCFGKVLVDRAWLGLAKNAEFQAEIVGFERLRELLREGKGLILLTAHVGNWQTALSHLGKLEVPVNALMHYDEEAAAKHYFDLPRQQCAFRIINTEGFLGGMVTATAALNRGEVVTIMGDRLTKGPAARVSFLGKKMNMPVATYALAASAQAPIVVMLAAKTSDKGYMIQVFDAFSPRWQNSGDRQDDLSIWTQRFAVALENYLQRYPYQWFNFFDYWNQ